MSVNRVSEYKSVHRLAFGHYLRTGERLTNSEWLVRNERKFNPYHDERGRFTSPPGVTVSWGKYGPPDERQRTTRSRGDTRLGAGKTSPKNDADVSDQSAAKPSEAPNGFRSELVRNVVSPQTSHADTYFELNKRQASLDRLRQQAGPNPEPVVKSDLEAFQRRLDADRARLDAQSRIADQNLSEILRAGLAPIDVAAGAINIASGEGELRDYLSVSAAVPIGGVVGNLGRRAAAAPRSVVNGITQFGGSYSTVRKLRGYHAHHIPAHGASSISRGRGPSIAMLPEDHIRTASHGNRPAANIFRKKQEDLIKKGDFRAAQQMDIDDIRSKFGDKYDDAIEQALEYTQRLGH